MKGLKLFSSILKIVKTERSLYKIRSIVEITTILARCGVLLLIYAYIFKYKGGLIGDTNFQIVAWSMFIYFAIMMLKIRDINRNIMADIKSGTVEILFTRPINYLWYKIYYQSASGFFPFLYVTVAGVGILYFWIGIPETMQSWFFVITCIITFIFSIINAFCIYILVGLLAFWIEDVESFRWIIDKFIMVLGGSYLPVALFPKILYVLAIYSPFGAAYFVTHTVNSNWYIESSRVIPLQIFWAVVLVCAVYLVFKKAQKKLSVNGG